MKRDAYELVLHTAHRLRLEARELAAGDLDAAIDAIDRADAIGPILDPTLYRDRHQAMREDEVTLRAVRVLARLGAPDDLTGGGAPEPGFAQYGEARASGSQVYTHAPPPVETPPADVVALRTGPAAS